MINASKEFKEKLREGANVVNYADVTLSDGTVLHLEPKDFMIGGCTIEDKTTDGKFGVGFVIGKTLTIKIANHDEQFSEYDFYNSVIRMYVALLMDDGSIEKIRKGVYYVTVPSTKGDIIEISAVDGMFKLDKDYSSSATRYPATLQTILTDACLDCDIPIGFRQFDNMSFIVSKKPENVTYRQIFSYAAQVSGYNVRIDNDGYMQLIWYNTSVLDWYNYDGGNFYVYPHDTIIDGGDFKDYSKDTIITGGEYTEERPQHIFRIKSLDVHTDDVQITGVKVTGDDKKEALFGETGYLIDVSGNPFVFGKEQEIADYLGNRMVGMVFRPFTAQILNNPLYEPFEVVMASDWKGNVYSSILNSISYTVGDYTQVSCEAEDPVRNGGKYYSEAAAAVAEARRNTENQITEYDKAVQNMNELAMNALGFFETVEESEDGSRITYMHDKPTLAESVTIYKKSIDGFFVSQDGGKSYAAGFDKNANAVVNVIYAIGVVADWIRTGKFVAKKGEKTTCLIDVDTGRVEIVADEFSLSSGDTINSIAKKEAKPIADEAAKEAVDAQTQTDIFNKFTDNGKIAGIFMKDNQLYINGTYISTGILKDANNNMTWNLSTGEIAAKEFSIDSTWFKLSKEGRIQTTGAKIRDSYFESITVVEDAYTPDIINGSWVSIGNQGILWHKGSGNSGYNFRIASDGSSVDFDLFNPNELNFQRMNSEGGFSKIFGYNKLSNKFTMNSGFQIPNNMSVDIYSHVDMHNFEIRNMKINNLVGINGVTPYTGYIYFITNIENTGNGGISWNRCSCYVRDGIITSVSTNAQS